MQQPAVPAVTTNLTRKHNDDAGLGSDGEASRPSYSGELSLTSSDTQLDVLCLTVRRAADCSGGCGGGYTLSIPVSGVRELFGDETLWVMLPNDKPAGAAAVTPQIAAVLTRPGAVSAVPAIEVCLAVTVNHARPLKPSPPHTASSGALLACVRGAKPGGAGGYGDVHGSGNVGSFERRQQLPACPTLAAAAVDSGPGVVELLVMRAWLGSGDAAGLGNCCLAVDFDGCEAESGGGPNKASGHLGASVGGGVSGGRSSAAAAAAATARRRTRAPPASNSKSGFLMWNADNAAYGCSPLHWSMRQSKAPVANVSLLLDDEGGCNGGRSGGGVGSGGQRLYDGIVDLAPLTLAPGVLMRLRVPLRRILRGRTGPATPSATTRMTANAAAGCAAVSAAAEMEAGAYVEVAARFLRGGSMQKGAAIGDRVSLVRALTPGRRR
ncbi:unnamed protein product, partial [Phaeothamnion confervicola]